ncbi:uncharacterized protein LOC125195277 [Salvia hispanica]|uniref:uncharacterized protein LOC125195277 n=1 Tax=Salvia hispanica TaxID=49212 RepID=UPI002009BCE5|nr:uncharacterized protein LOC125195277 [Salvia hispanica]
MSRWLFLHIASSLATRYGCFTLRSDANGRIKLLTIQKCTAAIRLLAYGRPADMFDEYLHMGETASLQVLRQFCRSIITIFGREYLRKPHRRLPDTAYYARESARFFRDDGQHRLLALGMEELPGGLERAVHYRVQMQTPDDNPGSWSNNDISVLQLSHLFNSSTGVRVQKFVS